MAAGSGGAGKFWKVLGGDGGFVGSKWLGGSDAVVPEVPTSHSTSHDLSLTLSQPHITGLNDPVESKRVEWNGVERSEAECGGVNRGTKAGLQPGEFAPCLCKVSGQEGLRRAETS